ncbi:probable serine/threonine-protein kinase PBL7 [Tripterygium wilfordii]|nr:probable serine/threonine-protein kinase PBL7 [Tripterygium wilfordii]
MMRYQMMASSPAAAAPFPTKKSNDHKNTTSTDHVHNKHQIWGILIIIIVTFLLSASLFLLIKRKVFPIFKQRWTRKGSLKGKKLMLRQFQMEELEKATNNFSEECLLGFGGFGNVYKGSFEGEGTLAIKRAHADSYQSIEEFRNEVMLLSQVKHSNLVGLVGFCEKTGAKGDQVLVYEYVPNGSLLEYIMGRGGRSLTWRQRVNIAIGAAKGIAHLHDGIKPSIIHRDIKPSNILIGDGFEAKVSDFGLVKIGPIGDQSHVSSQVKGTPGYLDPAYCSTFHLSPFSDVYSFGVILLQLVSARPAVERTRNPSNHHIIDWARPSLERGNIEEILDANLLSTPCNMEMMLKMGELGLRCVVKTPKDRPRMSQVWQELEEALYLTDCNVIRKEPTGRSSRSMDYEQSQSFVSIDGIGFQRFRVEMDSISFQSTSLRCFEASSVSIDTDKNNLRGISEETSREEDIMS